MALTDRRKFLEAAIAGAVAGAVSAALPGAAAQSARGHAPSPDESPPRLARSPADPAAPPSSPEAPALRVEELGQRLVAVRGAGGNVVANASAGALLFVDGGLAADADALWQRVTAELEADTPHTLFDTHWHPEQTGSNARFGAAGATIVAHENTKRWLSMDVDSPVVGEMVRALPNASLPNKTFLNGSHALEFGARRVEYGYLPLGHTDGDIYVFFRDANVLAAGGVVSSDGWPIIDWWTGGWIGGMLDCYEILLGLADAKTRVVPASGPVIDRAELAAQYEMFATIFERLEECLTKSCDLAQTIAAAPTRGFKEEWGDPSRFVEASFRSFWGRSRLTPRDRRKP